MNRCRVNRSVGDETRPKETKCAKMISCFSALGIFIGVLIAALCLIALVILSTHDNYCRNLNRNLVTLRRPLAINQTTDTLPGELVAVQSAIANDDICNHSCVCLMMENGSMVPVPQEIQGPIWKRNSLFLNRSQEKTAVFLKFFRNQNFEIANSNEGKELMIWHLMNFTVAHVEFSTNEIDGKKFVTVNINEELVSILFSLGIIIIIVV